MAEMVADSLVKHLDGSCERFEVAGSIRRQRESVGDADILCIPKVAAWTSSERQWRVTRSWSGAASILEQGVL